MLTIKDANGDGILQLSEFVINQDIIVLSMPEIAGLPYVISGLVAAGGLAAALSTADGLLLAIANALSHDVYYKMVDPHASTRRRLIVARTLLFVVALIAAAYGGYATIGHHPDGRLGVLASRGGPVRAVGARHLVEADQRGRRRVRHDRRLRRLPVLPGDDALRADDFEACSGPSCGGGSPTSPAASSASRWRSW